MTSADLGLSPTEAAERLGRDGPNELQSLPPTPAWKLLLQQFESPLVLILVIAAIISAVIGDAVDAVAIAVIVGINATIGFAQERRAERAMAALRSMTAPRATVRRGGERREIPAREVVVGDVLVLEAGDVVAADARVLEAHALAANEAVLTGESLPVDKRVGAPDEPVAEHIAERTGSVFMGTAIAGGSGEALVEATGMATQIGKIARLLDQQTDDTTPLQRQLAGLGRMLVIVCIGLVAIVAGLGRLHGMAWDELFMSSVTMAVAAVPEGLPAIITISLALGMQRMAAERVLVRRLAAVETLGSVTIICTDKTGTLTTGIMSVRELFTCAGVDERELLFAAAACSDAELGNAGTDTPASGDTTELALLRAARERGIERATIEREHPRVEVQPFSAERRRMSIVRTHADGEQVWVKGAVEAIIELLGPGHDGDALARAAEQMAARGLRVLAVAHGHGRDETNLRPLGLIGLADPPRAAAREAIARARAAGVRTVMITGDHPLTAHAIARELGLIDADASEAERAEYVRARTTAQQKTEIVRQLRGEGHVVAMTGDGVNDAPAIREADVGLAMGKTATEVTREASDMVLTDDDLGSVLTAIREGRVIYANIRKTIVYLLSGNLSQLLFMLVAAAVGIPFPLLPLQILWINLMTEPFPGLALAVDPPTSDVLEQPPRDPKAPLVGRTQWATIILTALLQTAVFFTVYWWALEIDGRSLSESRTLAFMTVVGCGLLRSFAYRSPTLVLWQVGALANYRLLWVVLGSLVMQVTLVQLSFTRELFGLAWLEWRELLVIAGISLIPVSVLELIKLAMQLWKRRRDQPTSR